MLPLLSPDRNMKAPANYQADIRQTVAQALAEDIGDGDITAGLIAADAVAQAQVTTLAERAAVDELMADYHGEPGAVFAVVRQGTVIFAEGYGVANLEHGIPLGRETVLDIGSVAKQFTAFAIALLADEGALSLDDDIRTHLPEVPDFGDVITIRHMVHHMSGLREIYTSEGDVDERSS